MAEKSTKNTLGKRSSVDSPAPPPSPRVRVRLHTIDDVKRELAKLYRETRAGKIESQDSSRMANMLSILGRMIEGSDIERRLAELEASHEEA